MTLLELALVIATVAILAAIAAPGYRGYVCHPLASGNRGPARKDGGFVGPAAEYA